MSVIAYDKRYLVTRASGITQPMMGKELAAVIAGRPNEITAWELDLMPHEKDPSVYGDVEPPVKATFPVPSREAVSFVKEGEIAEQLSLAGSEVTVLVVGAQPPGMGEARMPISELNGQLAEWYSAEEMATAIAVGREILAGQTVIVKGRTVRAE